MRRRLLFPLAALGCALLLAALAGGAWVAATPAGARWVLAALDRHTPLELTVGKLEGRLWDRLRLEGVSLGLTASPYRADIQSLTLDWRPLRLLTGRVSVRALSLTGLSVRDGSPPDLPPDLAWPRVSGLAALPSARVERLSVQGLSYRHPDGTLWTADGLATTLVWRGGRLGLEGLELAGGRGRLTGRVVAGLGTPSLELDLAAAPAGAPGGIEALALAARLAPGPKGEQVAGGFTLTGAAGRRPRLALTGTAALTLRSLRLQGLRLTAAGRRGSLEGSVEITPTAAAPQLRLQVTGEGIDLAPELGVATDLAGDLTVTGTPEAYRGRFALANRGAGWRAARLGGELLGDAAGLRLAPLSGALLGGDLAGALDVRWRDGLSLAGTLQGRNLDPARLSADWRGRIHLDAEGRTRLAAGQAPRGTLTLRLRESRLHDRTLSGGAEVAFAGEAWRIDRLTLAGRGFDLRASGALAQRLAFSARIDDLGRLLPEASGALQAQGWARWRDREPAGELDLRGARLAGFGVRLADLALSARLDEEGERPLHLAATLRQPAYGGWRAERLQLEAEGTVARHRLRAALRGGGGAAELEMAGGWARERWQGELRRLAGRDGAGPWRLAEPVPVTLGAGEAVLSPLVLTGGAAERLELEGRWERRGGAGSLRVQAQALDLARARAWLPAGAELDGRLTGRLQAALTAGERLAASGEMALAAGRVLWRQEAAVLTAEPVTARGAWTWQGRWPVDAAALAAGGLTLTLRADAAGILAVDGKRLAVEGLVLRLDGAEGGWQGEVGLALGSGGDLRATLTAGGPARLARPPAGEVRADWRDLDLDLLRPWLPGGVDLGGRLSGRLRAALTAGERLAVEGETALAAGRVRWRQGGVAAAADLGTARGRWTWRGRWGAAAAGELAAELRLAGSASLSDDARPLAVPRWTASLQGDGGGWRGSVDLAPDGGGNLRGTFTVPGPARAILPETGAFQTRWTDLDPGLLRPWWPGIAVEGRLAGGARGELLPGRRVTLQGETALAGGRLRWQGREGEIAAAVQTLALAWDWREGALDGGFDLVLAERGELRGRVRLPLPARLPLAPDRGAALQGTLAGRLREQGLLAALFPGTIQESRGTVAADLRLAGRWDAPHPEGRLRLEGAGGYVPAAGIRLEAVEADLVLARDELRLEGLRARSGPGQLTGEARIRHDGRRILRVEGRLAGNRFQTVHLPELQLLSSPDLSFAGPPDRIFLRGEVLLPEAMILGPPGGTVIAPSRDVIVEGRPAAAARTATLPLAGEVRLTLGERVFVRMGGIDARLAGDLDLSFPDLERITSRGEIRVVQGRYKAYGADLEILRGRLFYAGGPLHQPTLDVLALRTAGAVRAGVQAGGTLTAPVIRLYAEPPLQDADTLSYILFGRPLSGSREQASLLYQAAGLILSQGRSVVLQEQIKNRLGLSTLELQSGTGEAARTAPAVPATPAAVAAPPGTAGLADTVLTVGKYLTPEIYLSYGRSLFTGGNLFKLRYDLTPRWQIETQTGTASGVDLYYKIEFR